MFKKKCSNPLNQSFADHFVSLRKTADFRHMKHIALCYGKIANSISRYPLPILSSSQAALLEGVGTNMCKIFEELLEQRREVHDADQKEEATLSEKLLTEDAQNSRELGKRKIKQVQGSDERNTKRRKEANIFEDGAENYLYLVCCYLHSLTDSAGSISQENVNEAYRRLKLQLPDVSSILVNQA